MPSVLRKLDELDQAAQGLFLIRLIDASSPSKLSRGEAAKPLLYDQFGFEPEHEARWHEVAVPLQDGLRRKKNEFECVLPFHETIDIKFRGRRFGRSALSFELDLPDDKWAVGWVGQDDVESRRVDKLKVGASQDAKERLSQRTDTFYLSMLMLDEESTITLYYGPRVPKKAASVLAQFIGSAYRGWRDTL